MNTNRNRNGFPSFQVWRPSSPGSLIYNRAGQVQLQSGDQVTTGRNGFQEASISLNGDDRIEFQSEDVIAYYHPPDSRYNVRDIETDGYLLYRFDGSPPPTSVNLNERDNKRNFRQPLIQFQIGKSYNIANTKSNKER